jgi:MFS family permease
LAFGGIVVPKLNLSLTLICRRYLAERAAEDPTFIFLPVSLLEENPQCRIPEVQSLATKFSLYINLISGLLSAIASPKLGALSDRYGRKNLLALTTFGGLCAEVVTIICAKFPDTVPYQVLLVGAVFDGLCGSFTAGMALTHSYATDCTPPQKRAVAFGYFHACLFAGIAIGPLIAGYVVKLTGSLLSIFYLALACHTFFEFFILFVVPESLSKKRQLAAREKYAREQTSAPNTWMSTLKSANILAPLKILYPENPTKSPIITAIRRNLILLSLVDGIVFGTAMGSMAVVIYYSNYQFGWGNFETNIFVSIANSCRVSALILLLPLVNYFFRTRRRNNERKASIAAGTEMAPEKNSGSDRIDLYTIRIAVLFELLGYGGYAVVRSSSLFIVSGMFAAVGGIGSPTLQAALTKHVPHEQTGQLLGATGLVHALSRVVCPLAFSLIYAATVGKFTQTVFVVLSACFGVAFVASLFIKPYSELPPNRIQSE